MTINHPQSFSVILADDDEDDRLFFREAIQDLNINASLVVVNDGTQLMSYLNRNDTILPKLIFLDINMPGKNGIKILQDIRHTDLLKELPVAIYSTSTSPKDVKSALDNGADVYIKKPSDYDGLKKILSKAILSNWRTKSSINTKDNFVLSL